MTTEWRAVALMPNLRLRYSLEAAAVAIVPTTDRRVKTLRKRNSALHGILNRFRDGFGYKLEPSVLLASEKAPDANAGSVAIVAFRDIMAFCGSLPSQARLLTNGDTIGIVPQEAFAFYPWTYPTEKDRPDALLRLSKLHVVPSFYARSTPGPFPVDYNYKQDLDAPMLAALGRRWTEHFQGKGGGTKNEALFRALNLANEAALITTLPYIDISRVGKIVTLWCNAFELLVHHVERHSENSSGRVIELLNSVAWVMPESGSEVRGGRTAAEQIYHLLAKCRDDYMACRPVDTALEFGSNRSVLEFLSPLFRLALTSHLQMVPPTAPELMHTDDAFARSLTGRIAYADAQRACEQAIRQPWA
jgi:hypothetical protein